MKWLIHRWYVEKDEIQRYNLLLVSFSVLRQSLILYHMTHFFKRSNWFVAFQKLLRVVEVQGFFSSVCLSINNLILRIWLNIFFIFIPKAANVVFHSRIFFREKARVIFKVLVHYITSSFLSMENIKCYVLLYAM